MMDYLLTKRVYDFGLIYDGWNAYFDVLSQLVKQNNPNFASYNASNLKRFEAYYEDLFALFGE